MAKSASSKAVSDRDRNRDWDRLNRAIVDCERCPRLRAYCLRVAGERKAAHRDEEYWGLPVPNFGDVRARILIVGLAPAAHGANRTGRVFTGDRSGDFLFRAMHEVGLANQPTSKSRDDGLTLHDVAVTASCHCAPPANKPTPEELGNCREWLTRTIELLPIRVFFALGKIAWDGIVRELKLRNELLPSIPGGPIRNPKFAHGAVVQLAGGRSLVGSYHPSQQNTFTGVLTREMLIDVLETAKQLAAK